MLKRLFISGWAVMLLILGGVPVHAGELLDRVVATVNGHIILQSDWEDELRYEAFMEARSPEQISGADQKAALDRLIDQELLREQMRTSEIQPASDQEVTAQEEAVRGRYPDARTEQVWQAELARYGITFAGLQQRIALQLNLDRLIDTRLRPNVNIDAPTIESYYNKELLPQLKESGGKEVTLAEVRPQIRELLTQRQVSQLLTAWLQNLRATSEIRDLSTASGSRSQ